MSKTYIIATKKLDNLTIRYKIKADNIEDFVKVLSNFMHTDYRIGLKIEDIKEDTNE